MFVGVHAKTHADIGKTRRSMVQLPFWAHPHDGPDGALGWEWEHECGCLRHPTASTFALCASHMEMHCNAPAWGEES